MENQRNSELAPISGEAQLETTLNQTSPIKRVKYKDRLTDITLKKQKKAERINESVERTFEKVHERAARSGGKNTLPHGSVRAEKSGISIKKKIDNGEIKSILPKAPTDIICKSGVKQRLSQVKTKKLEEDKKLKELYESLLPTEETDGLVPGVSANRIKRARMICARLKDYNYEEKSVLLFPVIYQLHLYGYHRAEIGAILGVMPGTVKEYITECRVIFRDELLRELTSEDRVAESLAHYDFVKKEALRRASTASEQSAGGYLRLAALVESERNKLLEDTGYFEQVRRKNEVECMESMNPGRESRDRLIEGIRSVFKAEIVDDKEN